MDYSKKDKLANHLVWSKLRAKYAAKNAPQSVPKIACICSHSKYHHTLISGVFKGCIHQKECGCGEYQEYNWGNTTQP